MAKKVASQSSGMEANAAMQAMKTRQTGLMHPVLQQKFKGPEADICVKHQIWHVAQRLQSPDPGAATMAVRGAMARLVVAIDAAKAAGELPEKVDRDGLGRGGDLNGDVGLLLVFVIGLNVVALTPIAFDWNPGRWNWIGQSASLLFSLAFAMRYMEREEVGLRLPRSRSEVLWTIGGIVVALAIAIGPALMGEGTHPDAETFAYQATLPGPVEELAFRGVALALLMRTYGVRSRPASAAIAAALTTAFWFTGGHVVHLMDDGTLKFTWERMLDVFPMALLYATVRLQSRSLLGGILAHNGANTLVETVAAIRF